VQTTLESSENPARKSALDNFRLAMKNIANSPTHQLATFVRHEC